jgi:acyl-CoA hydrolase
MNLPAHQLTMTVLMTPDTANFSGNVHGGNILKLLDQVTFRQPIHVGELVTFLAAVNYTGRTSMEIGIKVVAENIRTQQVRHVNSCFFTMVAVGDDKQPVPVPPLRPFTPDEQRRYEEAKGRKELRLALDRQHAERAADRAAAKA